MSSVETIDTIELGLTGNVADAFQATVARPDCPLNLIAIATASHPELIDKPLGETEYRRFPALDNVMIVGMEQAREIEAPLVFSGLQTEEAKHQEVPMSIGRLLVTNTPANRMWEHAALYNALAGGDQIHELYKASIPGRIIAGGNCLTIQNVVAIAELYRQIGIESIDVKTFQGWSGGGYTEVPSEHIQDFPHIGPDEDKKIEEEPRKFLGGMNKLADIDVEAEAKRGTWVRNHYSRLTMTMARETSKEEILELLEGVRRPKGLKDFKYGPNSPKKRPVKLSKRPLLESGTDSRLSIAVKVPPMQVVVHVEEVSEDGLNVVLQVVGDNLILGAAGSNIMNGVYAHALGYL